MQNCVKKRCDGSVNFLWCEASVLLFLFPLNSSHLKKKQKIAEATNRFVDAVNDFIEEQQVLPTISPKPTTSMYPSELPSLSMEPTNPRCVVRSNLFVCSTIDYTTVPVDDNCSCYNFCDGNYLGCCDDEEICDINCVGFLVAGCEHPKELFHQEPA